MLKLITQLDIVKYSLSVKKLSARRRQGCAAHLVSIWDPRNISETTSARQLILKMQLYMPKYSFCVQ